MTVEMKQNKARHWLHMPLRTIAFSAPDVAIDATASAPLYTTTADVIAGALLIASLGLVTGEHTRARDISPSAR